MALNADVRRMVVDGVPRLPQFCHATMAVGWIMGGKVGLALGASVEIECIAYNPALV